MSETAVDIGLELAEVTFERFEKACLLLGLSPEDVRRGADELMIRVEGDPSELLRTVLAHPESIPVGLSEQLLRRTAVLSVREFFLNARLHVMRAEKRAAHYADWTGVEPLLTATGGDEPAALECMLVRFPPNEYFALRRAPLEDAMAYLLVRSVDYVAEHPTEFIPGYGE